MAQDQDRINKLLARFYAEIKDRYPVKKVLLYGSWAKGHASPQSDIDVGVVIDWPHRRQRVQITADLFHHARLIDPAIEPKCIFWDEFLNHEKASILSEIIRTAIEIVPHPA